LEFERAASLRDRIDEVRATLASAERLGVGSAAEMSVAAHAVRAAAPGRKAPARRRSKRRYGAGR
jgi:hypothetical protein